MVLICAWCNRTLRRGAGEVSHGICAACSRIFESGVVRRWEMPGSRRPFRREPGLTIPLPGFERDIAHSGEPAVPTS